MTPEQLNPPTGPRTWKRRWYSYPFVNPRLQLGMTFVPLLAGAIVAIYFSYLLYLYSIDAFRELSAWFPEKAPTVDVLAKLKTMWIKATLFIVFFELLILPILGLFFSHRLAGPLFVITKRLKELREGKMPEEIRLRKGSFLQDFAEDFNHSIAAIKQKDHASKAKIKEAISMMDVGNHKDALTILNQIVSTESYSSVDSSKSDSSSSN